MQEIWLPINGFENYEISNLGRVRSLNYHRSGTTKILKQRLSCGYYYVGLYNESKHKMCRVHRLVALAFVYNDDPEHKTQVNHKDECKTNNCADNLEWLSPYDNLLYGTGIERCAINRRNCKKRSKPVKQFTLDGSLVKEWPSASEIQRKTGFSQGTISNCCRGLTKKAYGYIWKY